MERWPGIGAFRHVCRNNEDLVRIVRSVDEIHGAVADGVLAVLLGFQNSTMLGDDPEMAGIFADVGIRVVQLTYNISNHLGSSCWEPHDGGPHQGGPPDGCCPERGGCAGRHLPCRQ